VVESDKELTPFALATVASAQRFTRFEGVQQSITFANDDAGRLHHGFRIGKPHCFPLFHGFQGSPQCGCSIGRANHKWVAAHSRHGCAAVRLPFIFNLILFGLERMSIDLLKKTPKECDFGRK
jgi:hypothetical protein